MFTSHTFESNTVNGKPLYYFVNQPGAVVPADAGQVIAAGCDDMLLEGLNVSDSSMGLALAYCKNAQIKNVTADRCGIFGVYLAYAEGGCLEGVLSSGANHAIDIRSAQSVLITDCVTADCEQGVFLSWAYDCVVDHCVITGCNNGFFTAVGADNQLSRCIVQGNSNGLFLQGEENMLLVDNEVTGNMEESDAKIINHTGSYYLQ